MPPSPVSIAASEQVRSVTGRDEAAARLAAVPGESDPTLLLRVQRDLAIALVGADHLEDCLRELLAAAVRLPGFDCGGTYLLDDATGELRLSAHHGLSETFVARVGRYPANSPQFQLVKSKSLFYGLLADLPEPMAAVLRQEGLQAIAILPLTCRNRLIGSLNLSAHHAADIPREARIALESVSALAHSALAAIEDRQNRLRAEQHLSLAVAGANLGTWRADLRSRSFEASARACELHGIETGGVATIEAALALIHPDDLDPLLTHIREAVATKGSFALEYRSPDGTRWIASEARYYEDHDGDNPRFIGVVREVTARKRMEEQLRASSQQLEIMVTQRTAELAAANGELARQSATMRLAMDSSGAGFRQLDLITGEIIWDARCRDLVGYQEPSSITLEEFFRDRVHPEFRTALKSHLEEVGMPGGQDDWDHEFVVLHPTRGEVWINSRGKAIRDDTGRATHLTGIVLDVTERKQTEALLRQWNHTLERRVEERTRELRESESRFRLLSEASLEGVVISLDGIVIDANPQLAAMLGYDLEEIHGCPVLVFIPPEERPNVANRIRGRIGTPYESLLQRKDGSVFPVLCSARILPRDDGFVRVTVLRDITETKQAIARVEAQRMELEQARSLAMISEISAGIIHQISSPLAAVGANVAAAATKLANCDRQRCTSLPIIQDVITDLTRIREIIVHLRSLSNPVTPQRVLGHLNTVANEVLPVLRREAEAREIHLETDLAPDLPAIPLDAVLIKQVLINLTRNAFDACTAGPPGRKMVRLATRLAADHSVEITVQDNGPGLSPEIEKRLFTPFLSTKPDGTGIGLRLCQTIIHAHHGTIEGFNSPDASGACFRVTLPPDRVVTETIPKYN